MSPIIALTTATTPKSTRSMPNTWAVGRKIGTMISRPPHQQPRQHPGGEQVADRLTGAVLAAFSDAGVFACGWSLSEA